MKAAQEGFFVEVKNVIVEKSKQFAVKIVRLYQFLVGNKEFVMSKQILRSGTSIGANVHEAVRGFSKDDFVYKMNISLKEASETEYWLELLNQTDYLPKEKFDELNNDNKELIRILSSIVKTSRTMQN